MYVIVGLGNPGREYVGTRHNVGFDVIEELSRRNNIELNRMKFNSVYGEGNIAGKKVMLMKPQTFMNNSGTAVREMKDFYKLPLENIIIILDDIDIEFGTIRIRRNGSAAAHNGMRSIIKHLGSQDFPRIKIGIGKKKHPNQDLADFVLSKFSKEEEVYMEEAVYLASKGVEEIISSDINTAMNKYN